MIKLTYYFGIALFKILTVSSITYHDKFPLIGSFALRKRSNFYFK